MEDNLKDLRQEYKEKKKEVNFFSEYRKLRKDYKEMKNTFKDVNKTIKENDLLESSDEFWNKFDFPTFDEFKENDNRKKEEINQEVQNDIDLKQPKYSNEDIDKLISDIDKKIEELDKKNGE